MRRHQCTHLAGHAIALVTLGFLVTGCTTAPKASPPACAFKTDTNEQAESGNVEAQFYLGAWYMSSCGNYDSIKAAKWYERAAENGHREAQYRIATMYYYSRGVAKDVDRSKRWYRKAAEQGEPAAARMLGDISYRAKDLDQAEKWYRLASTNGDTVSQSRLERVKNAKTPSAGKKKKEQVAKTPTKTPPQQKKKKSNRSASGKLNAVGRVKEALKLFVGGPIAGAYVGTAGGYLPTYPGLVGGAAIGGVFGLVTGVSVLVTGKLPEEGGSKTSYKSNKKKTTTAYSNTQVTQAKGLVGTWDGEFYQNPAWSQEIKVHIKSQSELSYSGDVTKFYGGSTSDCRGAEIKLSQDSGSLYSIKLNGSGTCRVKGKLRYTGQALTGKLYIKGWNGPATVKLTKSSGDVDQGISPSGRAVTSL